MDGPLQWVPPWLGPSASLLESSPEQCAKAYTNGTDPKKKKKNNTKSRSDIVILMGLPENVIT